MQNKDINYQKPVLITLFFRQSNFGINKDGTTESPLWIASDDCHLFFTQKLWFTQQFAEENCQDQLRLLSCVPPDWIMRLLGLTKRELSKARDELEEHAKKT